MATPLNPDARYRRRTARPKSAAQLAAAYPLSIVIPAHNAVEHLRRSVPALLENDLTHTEILLIDDESSDNLAEFVEGLPLAPLRLIRQSPRGGPAAARNRGIQESSHPYLLFLDADVVLPTSSLSWIRESLDIYKHRPEVAGVLGAYAAQIPINDFYSNYKNLYTCHLYRITDTLSPYIHTAIFCIRRDVIETAGGFESDLATVEDFRLGLRLGSEGYRFVIDRRVAGQHLKRYTLASILKEDARRIRDLRQVRVQGGQRAFSFRAHRWGRLLSVLLPLPTIVSLVGALWIPPLLYLAGALVVTFYAANLRFLNFCRRSRGLLFALKSGLFLWLEMLWAQWCLVRR